MTSYLTAAVLVISYSAGIISYLTLRTSALPFKDFRGILEDGSYHLWIVPNGAKLDYFKVTLICP
jgi:hypothetical protein